MEPGRDGNRLEKRGLPRTVLAYEERDRSFESDLKVPGQERKVEGVARGRILPAIADLAEERGPKDI